MPRPSVTPPSDPVPDGTAAVAGVTISHPDRLIFPDCGIRKLDLARYHEAMAEPILAELADRPLAFLRHPEGITGEGFFQRHAAKGWPPQIRSFAAQDGDRVLYLTEAAGLVAAVQMGVVEFHIESVHRDRPDRPDRLVFDLDPDTTVPFAEVIAAATALRDLLAEFGMPTGVMTTGGKGLHVVARLTRRSPTDNVAAFARRVAVMMVEHQPERFVAALSKAKRHGRILIDWQRNQRAATAVAPWTVRARPGAPVAVPLDWDDLRHLSSAAAFGLDAARDRGQSPPRRPEPVTLSLVSTALERFLSR